MTALGLDLKSLAALNLGRHWPLIWMRSNHSRLDADTPLPWFMNALHVEYFYISIYVLFQILVAQKNVLSTMCLMFDYIVILIWHIMFNTTLITLSTYYYIRIHIKIRFLYHKALYKGHPKIWLWIENVFVRPFSLSVSTASDTS